MPPANSIVSHFPFVRRKLISTVIPNINNTTAAGLPLANISRLVIDVTPANPNVVYVLAADNANGFKGIYKSSDLMKAQEIYLEKYCPNNFNLLKDKQSFGQYLFYHSALFQRN